jgi:GT2 family glycosyltransferase
VTGGTRPPDLTTIVVTWRNADVIGRCLAALRAGVRERSQEIVVVDNASDDGTPEVAARAAPEARIVVLPSNAGFAAANNAGMAVASGRFLALVNSDCFPDPGALDRLVDALEAAPEAGIVGGRLRYADGRHQPSAGALPTLRSELWLALGLHRAPLSGRLGVGILTAESLYRRPRRAGWVSGAFCAVRREVGPLPDAAFMYGEDVEWGAEAAARGFEVRLEPSATGMHLNQYSVQRSQPTGFIELRRVDSALRWFAPRGAAVLAVERAILVLHALLRLAPAAALIPLHGRSGVARVRGFAMLIRAALTTAVPAPPRSPAGRAKGT